MTTFFERFQVVFAVGYRPFPMLAEFGTSSLNSLGDRPQLVSLIVYVYFTFYHACQEPQLSKNIEKESPLGSGY